ncbi:type I DNA topoisomerase, partial [Candidatus Microgenomates bacterium]|nr:type I DNA topoisomerase [Candidatus Microgenomates bacterium]
LAFKAVEYWELEAKFSKFSAKLNKKEVLSKQNIDEIVENLKGAEFKIINITEKEARKNPYPPFTTSTLQQAASNLFGWSAKKTIQVAQNLYEAGFISYHRTDSTNLATEAVIAVREYINTEYGEKFLPSEPKLYKTKSKVAQEAHEAIRPTDVRNFPAEVDKDQKKLYELIWKRFVACQMAESVSKQTGVDILANDYPFRATGIRIMFEGWQKLYGREEGDEEKTLPELKVGDVLPLVELLPSQHFTQPPPRFNEASLIKALEEFGIGRPSTYAPIISTIQDRQYIEKDEKKLVPTALGMAVNDFLMANFGNIIEYKFTAQMEDELDDVANGNKEWVPAVRDFYDPFAKQLNLVSTTAERVKVETETTNEVCPNDGAPLLVRIGKFGKFLACSKFPDCKFTKPSYGPIMRENILRCSSTRV